MTSYSLGSLDDLRQTVIPYILLKVVSIRNLHLILDSYSLQPYVSMEVNNNYFESQVAQANDSNEHEWAESFRVDFEQNSELLLCLKDKDDFGGDSTLQKFTFTYENVRNMLNSKEVMLKIEPLSDEESEPHQISKFLFNKEEGGEEACVLKLEISYFSIEYLSQLKAEILNHRNIVKSKQAFTIYEVLMSRNDGIKWKVELRFSDFVQMRGELSKILNGVDMLPFPNKTYFDWIGRICTCASRFYEARIHERIETLQFFLNAILDNLHEFTCDSVTSLLKIPSPL